MKYWRATRERLAIVRPGLWFRRSSTYWESRYVRGGTSGAGSYGVQAEFKASFLNEFVARNAVKSVIEFGCGDGNQLQFARYPAYLGLDVSRSAVKMCADAFKDDLSKSFLCYDPDAFSDPARFIRADLALSLDVIYHLVEDNVFETYMRNLFDAADRFVIVYATDHERRNRAPHVRNRMFTTWIETHMPDWELLHVEPAPRPDHQDFHVFGRRDRD
jgi:cyclopropane fatty-acyl-phospholipid synthase-like methyltransferase